MPDDGKCLAEECYSSGVDLRRDGEYQLALQCFLEADKFANINSPRAFHLRISTLENIGFLYHSIGLPYKAIQVLTRARLTYECADLEIPDCITEIYRLLGASYATIGDYHFAAMYLNKARTLVAGRLQFRNEALVTQRVHLSSAATDGPNPTILSMQASIIASLVDLTLARASAVEFKQSEAEPHHQYFSALRSEMDQLCLEAKTALQEMSSSALADALCKLALAKAPLLTSGFGLAELGLADAITQLERTFGPTHPILFDWLTLAGRIAIQLGNYDRGELLIDRAISIAQKSFGQDSGRLIECFALLLCCPDLWKNQRLICECIRLTKIERDSNQIAYARPTMEAVMDLLSRTGSFSLPSDVTDEKLNGYTAAVDLLVPFIDLESAAPLVGTDDFFPEHNQGWTAARRRWRYADHQLYALVACNMACAAQLKQNYQTQEFYLRQAISIYKRLDSRDLARLSYLGCCRRGNVHIILNRLHLELTECLNNRSKHREADVEYSNIRELEPDMNPADFELYAGYTRHLRRTGQSEKASEIEGNMIRSFRWHEWQPNVPIKYQWRLLLSALKLHTKWRSRARQQ
jgi:tetratricopeptide (TPR) repeat protein